MSRTFRKSGLDFIQIQFRVSNDEYWTDYYNKRYRDGRSRNKDRELTKEHSTWKRRLNDKEIINDFFRGIDVEEIEYKDDRNLRSIIWNYA